MANEKLIIKENQKCKLTLETPYKKIETDKYLVFAETDYNTNGNNLHIEVNGLDINKLIDFQNQLTMIILNNKNKLKCKG